VTEPGAGAAEVQLRDLSDAEAPELHELIERNRAGLARWLRWARDQTSDGTLEFVRQARACAAARESLQRGVVVDGRIVGMVGLPRVDAPNHCGEIGYWLDEDHQGRGVMTAAVEALMDIAFDDWQLNRVEIRTDVENLPSRALAERLGFHFEGVLRQAYWVGDRYSDDAIYSMLAAERPRRGARLDGS
jgi:ribosomal-protein-serine acetyltransferase